MESNQDNHTIKLEPSQNLNKNQQRRIKTTTRWKDRDRQKRSEYVMRKKGVKNYIYCALIHTHTL